MMNKSLDGVVFRNVLGEREIKEVINFFKSSSQHHLEANFGSIWPAPFSIVNAEEGLTKYKSTFARAVEMWRAEFGSEASKFVEGLFNCSYNSMIADQLSFFTIREYQPGYGGIKFHCGRHLQNAQPYYYRHYFGREHFRQLSYFVVLQEAEIGGELNLFDLRWNSSQKLVDGNNPKVIVGQKEIIVSDLKKLAIDLKPGDMLVFNGSEIWHEVDDILGSVPRITLGGFMSIIYGDLAIWS